MNHEIIRRGAGLVATISAIFFGSVTQVLAQRSGTANASATIIQGLTMTRVSNLRFGAMIPGGSGGTITVSANGVRSATGSVTLLTSSSTPFSASSFSLLGQPTLSYSVVLPTSATLTRQGGSDTLLLNGFTSNPSSSGTLSSTGTGMLAVGGTITVSANQAAGNYLGSFSVTLTYQ